MLTLLELPAAERELPQLARPQRPTPPPLPLDACLPLLALDDIEYTQRQNLDDLSLHLNLQRCGAMHLVPESAILQSVLAVEVERAA